MTVFLFNKMLMRTVICFPLTHPHHSDLPHLPPSTTHWDLRWHGENRTVAMHSDDPQVSSCPNCRRFWSQAHVLCECPGSTHARSGGHLDLTIAISHLTPGPMQELGRHFQSLLIIPNQPALMANRSSGQWDPAAIASLQPTIARCSRKQIKAVLGSIGRVTSSTASACWRDFMAMARELNPTPTPTPPHWRTDRQARSIGILVSARITAKHGVPNPTLRQVLIELAT